MSPLSTTELIKVRDVLADVLVHSRGRDAQDRPTAYWAEVSTQGMRQKGWLFESATHSYEPEGRWHDQILQESVDIFSSYLANGWTCGK